MKVDLQIQGTKELNDLLLNLPQNVQRRVLQKAVNAAIKVGLKIVKAATRKSTFQSAASKKYGHLRSNLRIVTVKHPRTGQRGARIDTGDGFWGAFLELGTRHERAQPFMGPAFERAANVMLDELRSQLQSGIEQEAAKLRK